MMIIIYATAHVMRVYAYVNILCPITRKSIIRLCSGMQYLKKTVLEENRRIYLVTSHITNKGLNKAPQIYAYVLKVSF
jgi:hypothetical protein